MKEQIQMKTLLAVIALLTVPAAAQVEVSNNTVLPVEASGDCAQVAKLRQELEPTPGVSVQVTMAGVDVRQALTVLAKAVDDLCKVNGK